MDLKKWLIAIFVLLFLIGISAWIYYFPYQKHLARTETDQYLKAQGVKMSVIQSRKIEKLWMLGGYMTTIKYKNDPHHVYEYIYKKGYKTHGKLPYAIVLTIYERGSSVEDNQVKYPPLPDNYKRK